MNNLEIWDRVKRPPEDALKRIGGGRLKGMTDISPQWRYKVLTEVFGPCGFGWKYEIKRVWTEPGSHEQVMAFAEIALTVKHEDSWSDSIPGIGGAAFIAKESSGLHSSDEAYKMAVTDALSVALKMLGVAADIYSGMWDGSKYKEPADTPATSLPEKKILELKKSITDATTKEATKKEWDVARKLCQEVNDVPAAERLKIITIDHCTFIDATKLTENEDIPQ